MAARLRSRPRKRPNIFGEASAPSDGTSDGTAEGRAGEPESAQDGESNSGVDEVADCSYQALATLSVDSCGMQIYIKEYTPTERTTTLNLTRDTTMLAIKQRLGHAATDVELRYQEKALGDDETLFQHDISNGTTLLLRQKTSLN